MVGDRIEDATHGRSAIIGAGDREFFSRLGQAFCLGQHLGQGRPQLADLVRREQLWQDQVAILVVNGSLLLVAELTGRPGQLLCLCLRCHGGLAYTLIGARDAGRHG